MSSSISPPAPDFTKRSTSTEINEVISKVVDLLKSMNEIDQQFVLNQSLNVLKHTKRR